MPYARSSATGRSNATGRSSATGRTNATGRATATVPSQIVLFGDSITYNQGLPEAPTSLSWFSSANTTLSNAFVWRHNSGVAGDTTAQMAARLQGDVLSYSPAWVSILGGINDLTGAVPSSTTISNLTAIYDAILAAGSRLVVCVVLPCTSLTTLHAEVDTINTAIRSYAAAHSPVVLVDWWSTFSDPATDSGYSPKAGYTLDGKHPSATGAAAMGAAWAAAMQAAGAVPGT